MSHVEPADQKRISGIETTARPLAAGSGTDDTLPSVPVRARDQALPADYPGLSAVDLQHYAGIRELARGGMGRVRVARDRRLGRDVAIKELLVNVGDLPRRFEREARVTARLQHPSIVSVYEAGTWPSGEPFFAMPLVPGRSFDQVIDDARTLDARIALLPNVLAIADAIAYAHSEGIIHRDLKPKNVLVGSFGETVVVDWGLAKPVGDAEDAALAVGTDVRPAGDLETEQGEVMGTPAYMPPEQARGERVDARADVYALGALMFHALSGRPPVTGRTAAEVLANVLDGSLLALADVQPNLPPDLLAIVNRAMAFDPADRYPTARELADDLRRFQTGQLVGAHRYSAGQLLRRWLRRHRAAVAVAAVALVVMSALGLFSILRIMRAQDHAEQQRALAVANKTEVEDMLDFMVGDLRDQLAPVGRVDLLAPVARRAIAYLDRQPPANNATDMRRRMLARRNLGNVLKPLGDAEGALAQYESGLALAHALVFLAPGVQSHVDLADLYGSIADAHKVLGQNRQALAARRIATDVLTGWAEPVAQTNRALDQVAAAQQLVWLGDLPTAEKELVAALGTLDAQAKTDATARPLLNGRAAVHNDLANIALIRDDRAAAEKHLLAGAALADELVASDPRLMSGYPIASRIHVALEKLYLTAGRLEEAEAAGNKALKLSSALSAADPTNLDHMRFHALAQDQLCTVRLFRHAEDEALSLCRSAVELAESIASKSPTNVASLDLLVSTREDLARVQLARGQTADAIDTYKQAVKSGESLATLDATPTSRAQLGFLQRSLANLFVSAGRLAEARPLYEAAIVKFQNELDTIASARDMVADTHRRISVLLERQHDLPAALTHIDLACSLLEPLAKDRSAQNFRLVDLYASALEQRGNVYQALHRKQAARAAYRAAFAIRDDLMRASPQLRNLPRMAESHAALAKKTGHRGMPARCRRGACR